MKYLSLLILIFLFDNSLFAQDWVKVGLDAENHPFYIESKPVEKYGALIKFWTKQDLKNTTAKINKLKGTILTLCWIDCINKKIATIRSITYNSEGKVIHSYNSSDYSTSINWDDVVPGSWGEAILLKGCQLFQYQPDTNE